MSTATTHDQGVLLPPAAPSTVYKVKLGLMEYLKQTVAMLLSAIVLTVGMTSFFNGKFSAQDQKNVAYDLRLEMQAKELQAQKEQHERELRAQKEAFEKMLDQNAHKFDELTKAITALRVEIASIGKSQ